MHTDDDGVVHPFTLAVEVESTDVHYASCDTCGSRWAGPFRTEAMAAKVADHANASAYYELPARVRPLGLGLCHGPDGLPVGTPGALVASPVSQLGQLGQAANDVGEVLTFAGYGAYAALTAAVRFTVGAVRFAFGLGVWGAAMVGAAVLAAYLGLRRAARLVPDPAATLHVALGVVGVLAAVGVVAVLARSLLRGAADPGEAEVEDFVRTGYHTPLTPYSRGCSVSPVSKTPADEVPKG